MQPVLVACLLAATLGLGAPSAADRPREDGSPEDTSVVEHPFVASIGVVQEDYYLLGCAASVLDEYHVLSAAQCFDPANLAQYRVRAGSDYWKDQGQARAVARIFLHDKYDANTKDFDVAVVRLARPLVIGRGLHPARLVDVNAAVKPNALVKLVGWGFTRTQDSVEDAARLREVEVNTSDQEKCAKKYGAISKPVTPRMFCGVVKQSQSACQGEVGAPVVDPVTHKQIGLISSSSKCLQQFPRIFVNMANADIRQFIGDALKWK